MLKMLTTLRWGSLDSQRSRYHLKIAMALIVVIPMLSFCLLWLSLFSTIVAYSLTTQISVTVLGLCCGLAGYALLRQYPENMELLRDYLEQMAAGNLPEQATLIQGEKDTSDIERYLNIVIRGLHTKISKLDEQLGISRRMLETIENQSAEIVAAERQRVMIESLGAACHHLGQPATILSLYLSRVRDLRPEVLKHDEFLACSKAVDDIAEILKKLMHVSEYRTMPYTTYSDDLDGSAGAKTQIVDIGA